MPLAIKVGDVVELKKQHACGCKDMLVDVRNLQLQERAPM